MEIKSTWRRALGDADLESTMVNSLFYMNEYVSDPLMLLPKPTQPFAKYKKTDTMHNTKKAFISRFYPAAITNS
jgi:hypothetical protein